MSEFPSRVLFKPVAVCHRLQERPQIDGDLNDWEAVEPLPTFMELDGEEAFAYVFVGWSEAGLFIAEYCPKSEGVVTVNRRLPHSGDGLQVWVDTRASQRGHRATRFCHHFVLLPKGSGEGRMAPTVWQERIRRARGRPGLCEPEDIEAAAQIGEGHYTIEAHLPAHILNGYEPKAGDYIGFNYLVHDVHAGRQFWTVPKDFPGDRDPSLWGLLELSE